MKTVMLSLVIALVSQTSLAAQSVKSYRFKFSAPQYKSFEITQKAGTPEEAFKLAAAECFKKLTNGKYPGEEKGLQIIDICANPKI